jgi:hypothetical protein
MQWKGCTCSSCAWQLPRPVSDTRSARFCPDPQVWHALPTHVASFIDNKLVTTGPMYFFAAVSSAGQ